MNAINVLSESNYPELNEGLVLLIFVTEDCDLCSQLKKSLSDKLSINTKSFYVDSDEHHELDKKYSIAYNPTLVLLNESKVVMTCFGVPSQIDELFNTINELNEINGVIK